MAAATPNGRPVRRPPADDARVGYLVRIAAIVSGANEATRIEHVMTMTESRVRCLRNLGASLEVVIDCMAPL